MYKQARHAVAYFCYLLLFLSLYLPLSRVWAQIFPFPSVFIFSPASFQCLCTLSLPPLLSSRLLSSVPFVSVLFILKSVLELTPGCLFPAAVNWRFTGGLERGGCSSLGARQSSVSVFFKYASEHGWLEEQRNLWVLSTGSSWGRRVNLCIPLCSSLNLRAAWHRGVWLQETWVRFRHSMEGG